MQSGEESSSSTLLNPNFKGFPKTVGNFAVRNPYIFECRSIYGRSNNSNTSTKLFRDTSPRDL